MKRYFSLLACLFPLFLGGFQSVELSPQSRLVRAEQRLAAAITEEERFYALGNAAMTNYETDQFEKAEKYAKELLTLAPNYPKNWNYGNAIHKGYLVLGHLALKGGDLEKAKSYLFASVKSPGSPQLNSFGPNMTLAKELLAKGETESVLNFFTQCESFWKMGQESLAKWRNQIKEGKTPDFGGNLYY